MRSFNTDVERTIVHLLKARRAFKDAKCRERSPSRQLLIKEMFGSQRPST